MENCRLNIDFCDEVIFNPHAYLYDGVGVGGGDGGDGDDGDGDDDNDAIFGYTYKCPCINKLLK